MAAILLIFLRINEANYWWGQCIVAQTIKLLAGPWLGGHPAAATMTCSEEKC